MMTESLTLFSAFMIGLLGSMHCFGMCGGLVSALSFAIPDTLKSNNKKKYLLIAYQIGRISTYILLGTLFGLLGFSVRHLLGDTGGLILRTLASLLLILLGLQLSGMFQGLNKLEAQGLKLWQMLKPLTQYLMPVDRIDKALAFGMLWGLLPCGLVYSTMALAMSSGSISKGATLMLFFGLGTLPLMLSMGFFAQKLKHILQNKKLRFLSGMFVLLFGLWTLLLIYWPSGMPHQHMM